MSNIEKATNYYLSDWFGSSTDAPYQPWKPTTSIDLGWQLKAIFAVEEWAVEGGFEYQ